MKVFTQEEYDAIERDEYGVKYLPYEDYSQVIIKNDRCSATAGCEFGDWCKFGAECEFGDWCKFGEFFTHGKNTTFENGRVKNGTFVKVGRIGREMRDAYFFIDENGKFFVRAGCWFSDMNEFTERVHEVHGGTRHERQYLAACEYAKAVLPEMLEEVNG